MKINPDCDGVIEYWNNQTTVVETPWLDVHEKAWNTLGAHPFTAIDLGAGAGKDSLPLLMRECTVTAIELAEKPLQRLKNARSPLGHTMNVKSCDIRQIHTSETFDVVVCSLILHYLSKTEGDMLLQQSKQLIRPGGLILLRHFIKKGELQFFDDAYLPDAAEIQAIFTDWPCIHHLTKNVITREQNIDKTPKTHLMMEWLLRTPSLSGAISVISSHNQDKIQSTIL